MKINTIYIRKYSAYVAALVILTTIIGFSKREEAGKACQSIHITIDNQYDNYYINEDDIRLLMSNNGDHVIVGTPFDALNFKEIEARVYTNPYIRSAEIYRDLKGNMIVEVELRRAMARLIGHNTYAYISEDGTFLPRSDRYSTRCIVVSGKFFDQVETDNLLDVQGGRDVFNMINYIRNDDFWKAQMAEMEIDASLDITLYPQVTKQVIEFGEPVEIPRKFKKLEVFYRNILPRKGWNTYERVNVKYNDQIIAE